MNNTINTRSADIYFDLVREFPLRRIRSDREHRSALKMLRSVDARYPQPSQPVIDYMDLLAHLIEQYEQNAGLKLDLSGMTPGAVVRHLMKSNGLTVTALADEIGVNQGNLSGMLAGNREFSKAAIVGLSERFGLPADLFLR